MDGINEPVSTGGEVTGSENSPGTNPAWNDVLNIVPEQFHAQITPHFQKWDQSAQSRIEEVNGRYKDYNPLVEHGITPQQVFEALQLTHEINTNPRSIYDALNNAYNFGVAAPVAGIDPQGQQQVSEETDPSDPRYNELKQGLDLVSQIILQDQQAKEQAAESRALEQELTAAFAKHQGLERNTEVESYVLAMMHSRDLTAEQALDSFMSFKNSLQPAPFAPRVLGSQGGGVPSSVIDPAKLSRQETKSLVAQMLQAAAQQRG